MAKWCPMFGCDNLLDLYCRADIVAKSLGLEKLPFTISDLENHTPEVDSFMFLIVKLGFKDNSDAQAKELIKYLKENPPKESYGNPRLAEGESTQDEKYLMNHIFLDGIDLPGSKYNPFGHLQYFTSFFMDVFFGNYTEFMDHINSLSTEGLKKELDRREGYCQFSITFAPILGLKIAHLEHNAVLTRSEKREIRLMYSGNNENKHYQILEKLLELGADANDHDIYGYTPLHYALFYPKVSGHNMASLLLKYGANPNFENKQGERALSLIRTYNMEFENHRNFVDVLLEHNATLTDKKHINQLRWSSEKYGDREFVARVRKGVPRDKNECEKCVKVTNKMCSACGQVSYCTPACQKLDWKFHKISCRRSNTLK